MLHKICHHMINNSFMQCRKGSRLGHDTVVDGMLKDGLWDVYNDYAMGMCAELCSEQHMITREEQVLFYSCIFIFIFDISIWIWFHLHLPFSLLKWSHHLIFDGIKTWCCQHIKQLWELCLQIIVFLSSMDEKSDVLWTSIGRLVPYLVAYSRLKVS